MNKLNPLFVDSTKLSSDSIGCAIELKGVPTLTEEQVYVKIKDSKGNEESYLLNKKEDLGLYTGQVWLNHQQEVVVRFYIMSNAGVTQSSMEYKSKGAYILEYTWKETTPDQKKVDEAKQALRNEKALLSQEAIISEFSELSQLIDKWGL